MGSLLAPIMASLHQYNISAKLTETYIYSCHQQPDRSFWIFGYPMALCCRCFGFYTGVAITTVLAMFNKLNINIKTFIFLSGLVIFDIVCNYFLKNNTGNIIRFFVGIIMGILFTVCLCYLLKNKEGKIHAN